MLHAPLRVPKLRMSFDPFASFAEEPANPTPTSPAPTTAPVAQASQEVAALDPFGSFVDTSAHVEAPPADFKVTVTPESVPEAKSSFASAHLFAAPDHVIGEHPTRIPVTPIKGDASGVPLASTSSAEPSSSSSSTPAASTAAVNKASLELAGPLEKLAEGFLGESWNARWCGVKHNRFGYYNSKADPRPKGFVYFDEADVGIPQNLAHTAEYQFAFQIAHERKNLNWFFRAQDAEQRKKWLGIMSANIKHYKTINSDTTILERILSLSIVKDQFGSEGAERSFRFYTSKISTGWYAVVLCVLMELLIRKVIDIVNTDEIILASDATYSGMGLFDDTLDLIASKVKQNHTKSVKISELLPILLYGGGFVGSMGYSLGPDAFLSDPVLRAIDHATRRGTLDKLGPKRWAIKNTQLEEQLITQLNSLQTTPFSGNDVKEHATIAIAYTMLRASSRSPGADQLQHDVLDRLKIFPKLPTSKQVEEALDKISKNLGSFEKKQATLLKALHTATTDFILGPVPK